MRWEVLVAVIAVAASGQAAEEADYLRDVKPLLAAKCGACHGVLANEAGLRLDAGEFILSGGDAGTVVTPGESGASLLIERVSADDPSDRMPPEEAGEALDAEQIALLKSWIDAGAKFPDDEEIPVDPADHWAYQPPVRPAVPEVKDAARSHPIDAFIAREQARAGVEPVDVADPATLLRRAYLDLVGLPPTRAQQAAIAACDSPQAWSEIVESLLASPHFGERWGRHWMDVWRYSDWDGYQQELRGSQRHIWRWRDWIVRSLNNDLGYDEMVVAMLAGDEAAPGDLDALAATGFLGRNYHNSNRDIWLDATVEHTAKAFLGVTLNCARCHDHKFDPLPQREYYQFRAIFEPHRVRTDRLPGEPSLMTDGLPRAFDAEPEAPTYLYVRGDEKHPDKEHPLAPAVPAVLGGSLEVRTASLPVETYYPAIRRFVMEEQLAAGQSELAEAQRKLADALADKLETPADVALLELQRDAVHARVRSLEVRQAADRAKFLGEAAEGESVESLAVAAARMERRSNVAAARVEHYEAIKSLEAAQSKNTASNESSDDVDDQRQAAIDAAQKKVDEAQEKLVQSKAACKQTDGSYTPLGEEFPHESTGRRLALARWITSRDNPLAARVAINHVWLRHFGAPLVENVFDFGLRSPRPRHADLLDWLAVELMENNWSLKHLHRLILTSRTWRLASSSANPTAERNRELDPDNKLLWRANVRRLEAEIVRDAVLAASGELDETLGGPDIPFTEGEKSQRRSIYLQHAYEKQMTMLVQFDAANPTDCYRRSESVVPQQALALANSSLSLGQSRLLAGKLRDEATAEDGSVDDLAFVRLAFLQTLARDASDQEAAACRRFLENQASVLSDASQLTTFLGGEPSQVKPSDDPRQRARENLIHVLFNHNDFITVR